MKCLLINPEKYEYPPMNLLSIGAVLERSGHEVRILELGQKDLADPYDQTAYRSMGCALEEENRRLLDEQLGWGPDVVGVGALTPQVPMMARIFQWVRLRDPSVAIVAGGVHPTAFPEESLHLGADVVVLGEGEFVMQDILDALSAHGDFSSVPGVVFRADGEIRFTGVAQRPELDELPLPAYHLCDSKRFSKRGYGIRGLWLRCGFLWTSRGCPSLCTFCCSPNFFGTKVREKSIDLVMEELQYLIHHFNIEGFLIVDDTFTVKTHRVKNFCRALLDNNIRLKWACQARTSTFNEDMAVALKEAGCVQVEFGVESGSQKVLDAMKKGTKVEHSHKAFEICRKHKMRALAFIMVGNVEETREDIEMTRELLHEIKPAWTAISYTTPYPGSVLYEQAVEKGWIKPYSFNVHSGLDREASAGTEAHLWQQSFEPVMEINFTKAELKEICDSILKEHLSSYYNSFILQPHFIKDISCFLLRRPKLMLKLAVTFFSGKRKIALEIFNHTFRRDWTL